MSVYSGFATRAQQTDYDNLLFDIMTLLSMRIIKFYKGQEFENSSGFFNLIKSQNRKLKTMEKQKYLEIKYSPILMNLLKVLGGDNMDVMSVSSSSSMKQVSRRQRSYITTEPYYKNNNESQFTSERTYSLERIIERRMKKKKSKKRQKRFQSEAEIIPIRIPQITRIKERSLDITPDRETKYQTSRVLQNKDRIKYDQLKIMQLCQNNVKSIANASRFRSKMYFNK